MKSTLEDMDRARELILGWCDDRLTPSEGRELEALLSGSKEAQQLFASLTLVNATLESFGPAPLPVEFALHEKSAPEKSPWHLWSLAIAAAVTLMAGGAWLFSGPAQFVPPNPVVLEAERAAPALAIVTHAIDTRHASTEKPLAAGALVSTQRIQLEDGLLQLQFFNGVNLVIEGPADFEILSMEEGRCRTGRYHANVPQHAQGFVIHTPSGELIDFGTEFGLHIGPAGESEIHVFEGEIAFHSMEGDPVARLNRGDSAEIDVAGTIAAKGAADADLFSSHREVNQWHAMSVEKRFAEWYHRSGVWRSHSAMLSYFDFDAVDYLTGLIPAYSSDPYLDDQGAVLVGARNCTGRWPGKGAFDFSRTSDRIRARIPGSHDALTLVAWVKIDHLGQRQHGLLMSDGQDDGALHWGIDAKEGRLTLETYHGPGLKPVRYASDPVITPARAGQWLLLASVYDRLGETVAHYVNGEPVGNMGILADQSLRIGVADIGNWTPSAIRSSRDSYHFDGIIDEFMVFGAALSETELRLITRTGMPDSM